VLEAPHTAAPATLAWVGLELAVGAVCYALIIFLFAKETVEEFRQTLRSLRHAPTPAG
jgi:hypothetical protein